MVSLGTCRSSQYIPTYTRLEAKTDTRNLTSYTKFFRWCRWIELMIGREIIITFFLALHESDSALVVRTKSPKVLENITIKRLYVLLPCIEEGYFLMLQITPAELVLPHVSLSVDVKEYDQEDELLENIKAEVTSSLNKIPFQEYYDPFEHSSGTFPSKAFHLFP